MLTIDRFEGEYAVCETDGGGRTCLPLSSLPDGVQEGDILIELSGGYQIDFEETERRRAEAAGRLSRLFKRGDWK